MEKEAKSRSSKFIIHLSELPTEKTVVPQLKERERDCNIDGKVIFVNIFLKIFTREFDCTSHDLYNNLSQRLTTGEGIENSQFESDAGYVITSFRDSVAAIFKNICKRV